MRVFNIKYWFIIVLLAGFQTTFYAQEESVGTEVVNIVKPYQASVPDAFKIRETPSLEDDENSKQETINYQIFSFPVASTFQPQKGSASKVQKTAKEKLFNNYAYLGAGNYGNVMAGVYLGEQLSDNDYINGSLTHRSGQGGIKDVYLNDQFYVTNLDVTYGYGDTNMSWTVFGGYQHQINNWYGLPLIHLAGLDDDQIKLFTNQIVSKQTYQNILLGGDMRFTNSFFKGVDLAFNRFSDAFNSAENHFTIQPELELNISDFKIKTLFDIDYQNAVLDKNFANQETKSLILGARPSIGLKKDNWSFNFGTGLYFNQNMVANNNKFYVYPDITAQLNIIEDVLEFFGGATGGLLQNTYREAVQHNPFVSPDLMLMPTSQQLNGHAGLKGKFSSAVTFNLKGAYLIAKSQPLFRNNAFDLTSVDSRGFDYGNSFSYVYDDINTLELRGEVKADFNKNSSLTLGAQFNDYNTTNEQQAWNLPSIQFNAGLDLRIAPKWHTALNVFFVGDRKDVINYTNNLFEQIEETDTLKSFLDANLQLQYFHNKQLTGFLSVQNLANQQYQRFLHTPVQGLQVLLGAKYQFDF